MKYFSAMELRPLASSLQKKKKEKERKKERKKRKKPTKKQKTKLYYFGMLCGKIN